MSHHKDPRTSSCIYPEVAESWIRSRNCKVNPYMESLGFYLNPKDFSALMKEKKRLIETTSAYIKNFIPLLTASDYLMCLTDEHGVILLVEGSEKEIESFAKIDVRPSVILSEELVGTTAHALCIHHRKPVQLIGPYNYCIVLQDNISSATPILDESGDVIGTLVVVQMLAKKDLQDMQSHSLGWVISMGYAIENLLKTKKQNYSLRIMNGILEATLSLVDQGIVTVNKEGQINHINKEGAKIFGIPPHDVTGRDFRELMKPEQILLVAQVLQGGKPVQDFETTIAHEQTERQFFMNVKPVLDGQEEVPKGAVIRFVRTEKVDRLIAHRGGARAMYTFEDIIGTSPALERAMKVAKHVGKRPYNILLNGESGTGKELFAQAIHNLYRSEGPFVAINCASMPRNLIESELFGYEAGAFTGAERKGRPGKIELANGGTLFLDEIGDMPIEIQPVLLRVLEDKRVMRLGSNSYIPVDFRVVAATSKNLYQMVQEKSFREDLYFRLSIFKIPIAPLRDRGDDIILLAKHFIEEISRKIKCKVPEISPEAYKKIVEYSWPGNVRQLENAMVYAVNMAQDGMIKISHLPDELIYNYAPNNINKHLLSIRELEKMAIKDAMAYTRNNTMEMARILGLGRTTLYRKLKEYDIKFE
ncbi:sigma-54-dependent Fis family transcriptional regulator [Candidatus Formimonas warabiya]|uniref:Sigma-54-dependent Fis family transcriptional regulator n=1 Tax=Formimonas warabiya TaxID=1761012 RepID=A0A3G1L1V2_FORW1|nr:sigma-54-dependent Fis family transcriptional regulator [Candidatus Formimonas warabiya]